MRSRGVARRCAHPTPSCRRSQPWVEDPVAAVDDQIRGDNKEREVHDDALDHRQIAGASRFGTAVRPRPGMANTDSMATVPPNAPTNTKPTTVMIGIAALRSACRSTIDRSPRPGSAQRAHVFADPTPSTSHHASGAQRSLLRAPTASRSAASPIAATIPNAVAPSDVTRRREPAQVHGKHDDQHEPQPEVGDCQAANGGSVNRSPEPTLAERLRMPIRDTDNRWRLTTTPMMSDSDGASRSLSCAATGCRLIIESPRSPRRAPR